MGEILARARENKDWLEHAPYNTPVRRLDEVTAAKKPVLTYKKMLSS